MVQILLKPAESWKLVAQANLLFSKMWWLPFWCDLKDCRECSPPGILPLESCWLLFPNAGATSRKGPCQTSSSGYSFLGKAPAGEPGEPRAPQSSRGRNRGARSGGGAGGHVTPLWSGPSLTQWGSRFPVQRRVCLFGKRHSIAFIFF